MEVSSRIPEKLFFRIGEVCELIKVQPHVLRYWETEFPMLTPQKNRAGQRVYRRRDVEIVMRIRNLLYEEKFTIAGAKKKLQDELRPRGTRPPDPPIIKETKEVKHYECGTRPPDPTFVNDPPDPSAIDFAIDKDKQVKQVEPLEQTASPETHLALRLIRRDLEDLLTMLKSDVSIKN
jgi:DNA-binding transcriptional MerR regulator